MKNRPIMPKVEGLIRQVRSHHIAKYPIDQRSSVADLRTADR
jgi:hypothetical protein